MKIGVFISSVQKGLADERLALQVLLTTDPFLMEHCVPILFERYPAPLISTEKPYLKLLDTCQVYIGMLWKEYGQVLDGLSATHHEYRHAKSKKMPMLIMVKGSNKTERDTATDNFINEIKQDNHTYSRFDDIRDLEHTVYERLILHIRGQYHLEPTFEQSKVANQTIKIASAFERQRLEYINWDRLDKSICWKLIASAEKIDQEDLVEAQVITALWTRGYLWKDTSGNYHATASGILLLGKDPSAVFPHARLQLSVFSGRERTHTPIDHCTICKPLPHAIDEVVSFVRRNTRHPLRVVGLNRVELDEYPDEALREALVNALAHRNYEDASRRITVDVFSDRIEIVSPGNLPAGLTLARLRKGQARSWSRNPCIAHGLTLLGCMEERGTGIRRMKSAMLDHGLDEPQISLVDGEVVVILTGPGENIDRLRPSTNVHVAITPAVEAVLTERQRLVIKQVLDKGKVTSGWCCESFNITRETAVIDLNDLVKRGLLQKKGKGRGVHYVQVL